MFKQKTAYEMRISDWSSVVCSSDLDRRGLRQGDRRLPPHRRRGVGPRPLPRPAQPEGESRRRRIDRTLRSPPLWSAKATICLTSAYNSPLKNNPYFKLCRARQAAMASPASSSEEHTSELQSLMRISFAVFSLNKKNNN